MEVTTGGDRPLDDFGPRSWARPEVTGVGRLPSARLLVPFDSPEAAATAGDERDSPWHLDLGGTWRFRLRTRPEAVTRADLTGPTDGIADDFADDSAWCDLDVPGTWTMQGHDRPHYTNVQLPIPGPPPAVPDANPTGVHRRTLVVPEAWAGRRIVLHVGGAESVLYAHVDGTPVAMGKDSRLPHAVDLTGHVTPGCPAELALTVVRWSDATYLEDQDHWHHAGLHRDVIAYATDPVHVAALRATADLDPATGTGHLRVAVHVDAAGDAAGSLPPRGWTAEVRLLDPDGHPALPEPLVGTVRFEHPDNWVVNFVAFAGRGATVEADLPGVLPWSADTPHLYRLLVTLVDGAGLPRGTVTERVGFRRVEVRGHELLVNGRAVLVKGVNRHDHDPRTGKAVTREAMRADVLAMKRHNLNALRTSHYPNHHHLYELCDELGLYVVDEADLETHAYMRSLTKDPVWLGAIVERVARMARRDVDHPSVIIWSLGNEAGTSPALDAAAAWLRSFDPTRPVQYEGDLSELRFAVLAEGRTVAEAEVWRRPQPASDLLAPMYPPVDQLVRWATEAPPDRPLVMCEYQHAMGNSCGSMADYWDAIRAHPGLQGGFVWDWMDQALLQVLPDGTERWAYGGDFGDHPTDATFCCNGLLGPDRVPHPALLELATVVQPVRIDPVDAVAGVVRVTAETDHRDLSHLVPSWELVVDGEPVATGELPPLALGPGASTEVRVPLPAGLADLGPAGAPAPVPGKASPAGAPEPGSGRVGGEPFLEPGQVAHLTVRFALAADEPWAPAGHVVAWEQLEVARAPAAPLVPAERFGQVRVDPAAGALVAPGLLAGPELVLWRAPTDNDAQAIPSPAARWRAWGLDRLAVVERTAIEDAPGVVRITERLAPGGDAGGDAVGSADADADADGGADAGGGSGDGGDAVSEVHHEVVVRALAGGGVHVAHTARVPEALDDLPRVGVRYVLAPGHEQVDWLGRGPHEGYVDRCASTRVGRWHTAVDDWPVRYVHPQATGNRTGVRWLRIAHADGGGLTVDADAGLQVTVAHHTDEDLAAAAHADELARRPETYLWLDAAHRGVGTGACGPDTLDRYRVPGGTRRWSYTLRAR